TASTLVSGSESDSFHTHHPRLWNGHMTTPYERSRALIWAGGLLIELARDERLPLDVRQKAARTARHFPTIEQVGHLAATLASSSSPFGLHLEDPGTHAEWAEGCKYGPLTWDTRLRWPEAAPEE